MVHSTKLRPRPHRGATGRLPPQDAGGTPPTTRAPPTGQPPGTKCRTTPTTPHSVPGPTPLLHQESRSSKTPTPSPYSHQTPVPAPQAEVESPLRRGRCGTPPRPPVWWMKATPQGEEGAGGPPTIPRRARSTANISTVHSRIVLVTAQPLP